MDYLKTDEIKGKVAVITGGAGVLCSEMARSLGNYGIRVVILDIDEEALHRLSHTLQDMKVEHLAIKTNVLEKDSIRDAANRIMAKYGRVDFLINGAGGNKAEATTGPNKSFFDLPVEAIEWVFNLNFLGTFLVSQVFGKVMAEQKEGIIINISSMNAFTPLTEIPAYSAAKAAVSNFTQWLAVHMSQNYSTNIRVNAIAPGFLLTEQNRFLLTNKKNNDLTARGQTIIDHTPMNRFGNPEDLITTILWLILPASSFVHGAVIPIDGGFSAFSGV
jgi:NAD(P)-dependent dehydrogenase (short-subunit alcohol dehydrogenase family)